MRVLIILLVGYKKKKKKHASGPHFLRQPCKHAELVSYHHTDPIETRLCYYRHTSLRTSKEKWYSQATLLTYQRPLYTRLSNHGHNVTLNTTPTCSSCRGHSSLVRACPLPQKLRELLIMTYLTLWMKSQWWIFEQAQLPLHCRNKNLIVVYRSRR